MTALLTIALVCCSSCFNLYNSFSLAKRHSVDDSSETISQQVGSEVDSKRRAYTKLDDLPLYASFILFLPSNYRQNTEKTVI